MFVSRERPVRRAILRYEGGGGEMEAEEEKKLLWRLLKTSCKPRGLEEDTLTSSPPFYNTSPSSLSSPLSSSLSSSSSSSSSSKEEPISMEHMLWSNLPEELVERVLASLPPLCLFRLRSVCHRWNSVVSEPGFLRSLLELPSHGPCFLVSQRLGDTWQSAVYSHPLAIWHSLPLKKLPCKIHSLISSAGGLLCLGDSDNSLFLCNPLSGQWKKLPETRFRRHLGLVNLRVDRPGKRYWVVAGGDSRGPTEVYDSRTQMWAVFRNVPEGTLHSLKSTFCNGKLYCLTLSPCGLVSFNLEQGVWESIPTRMPRSLLDAFLIAGEHNSLLLVGRVGLYSVHQSMHIWALDKALEWVELARMPHLMFKSLLSSSAESFQCFGQGSFVCFSAQKQQKWLMYNTCKKAWNWFSGCPRFSSSCSQNSIKGFFYEPRLDASVH